MGRPRNQATPRNIAAKIRAEALEHFGRRGFDKASLSEIASAVGVTRTTLLYHYESKEKLYDASVHDAFTAIASTLVQSVAVSGSFAKRLRNLVDTFLNEVEAHPHLAKLMIREVIDERETGCRLIVDQGMTVLNMVEEFFAREGRVSAARRPLLREVLLLVTSSVMMKSASGALREPFWGKESRTSDLTNVLFEALLLGPASPTLDSRRARPAP